MAELFDTLKLTWDGEKFELYPTIELIARVENIITAVELFTFLEKGAPPFAKLSLAYGLILRAAGAKVTDEEVYGGMFSDDESKEMAAFSVAALLQFMIPKDQGESSKKKPR